VSRGGLLWAWSWYSLQIWFYERHLLYFSDCLLRSSWSLFCRLRGFWSSISSASSVRGGVFLKFSEGLALTKPSLLVCSGLDAMSGPSRCLGVRDPLHPLLICVAEWLLGYFCFFMVGSISELLRSISRACSVDFDWWGQRFEVCLGRAGSGSPSLWLQSLLWSLWILFLMGFFVRSGLVHPGSLQSTFSVVF
jgi:hypothetical protein